MLLLEENVVDGNGKVSNRCKGNDHRHPLNLLRLALLNPLVEYTQIVIIDEFGVLCLAVMELDQFLIG